MGPQQLARHMRSNAVAYLALFVALGGSAYAARKIGSSEIKPQAVLSKHIRNEQVRSKDIKNGRGVKSSDVVDDSISGDDVEEASLGRVPDADALDGHDSTAFVSTDQVHDSGKFVLNDPTPGSGGGVFEDIFSAGPFTVRAFCRMEIPPAPTEDTAQIDVQGPPGTAFSMVSVQGTDDNNVADGGVVLSDESTGAATTFGPFVASGDNEAEGGHFTALSPSGEFISVSAYAEVNDPGGSDCTFGATAIGP